MPLHRLRVCLYCMLVSAFVLGCGSSADYDTAAAPDTSGGESNNASPSPDEPSAPVETERVKAEVGVGVKGRSLDGYKDGVQGAIASPVTAYFNAKQKIAFEIQLKHAVDLYKATNGRLPATHEAFMTEIVAFNKINLPELPAGHKYVFDPERGELMVERPKQ